MRHVVLIGLSGSGKSSLGKLLAERTDMPFVDLDLVVEQEAGMRIKRIFDLHGEPFFREMETRVLREATSASKPSVIATGGGAVLRAENVDALRKNGFVVFLDRPVHMIASDIPCDSDRPLVTGIEKIYEMESQRRELYLSAADRVLQNNAGIGEAVSALEDLLAEMSEEESECSQYAVIGDPIAHTLSPAIHGIVFETLGVTERYTAVRVPRGGLPGFVERARASGVKGFNVTIPHKRDIIPLLDEIEEEAKLCGAVNTVVIRDKKLSGFNTDMGGLLASLKESGYGCRGRRVLILGAGGAARGVAFMAAREGASGIVLLARRPEKATEIASDVRNAIPSPIIESGVMSPDSMTKASRRSDILINTTPLGMSGTGEDFSSFEFLKALPAGALVCDLVYKPAVTNLLRSALDIGATARNGLGMLVYQALLADELFLGQRLDKAALYKTVKGRLII
ncbi:MAG: shikimate dehydrogenase [Synergistaceae bacterium]|jgi:shikimate dehydrogenase|nr:shikimate dehydrogenase [Synergistaceae bacterium]